MTKDRVYIIGEAGVNHNGSLEIARRLVDAASTAGVDAVKFQTFKADRLLTKHAPKADYQAQTTAAGETQYEMIKKLELSESDHLDLIAYCREKGVEFLSTPFDSESLQLLTGHFGLRTIKISSGDITNAPFLLEVARSAENVILSTGMSTLAEVENALGVLAFGFALPGDAPPRRDLFEAAYASDSGRQFLRQRVSVLHCTTEYPAPVNEVNLRAVDTLAAAFGLRVGYSDHTSGIHIPIAAVARGSSVIEKHFTLDRNLPGPDHKASLEPEELQAMVRAIRDVEASLGDGIKRPTASEWKNRTIARKSLVVEGGITAGEPLVLACKRPGLGVSPLEYWNRSGRPANRDYAADEALDG